MYRRLRRRARPDRKLDKGRDAGAGPRRGGRGGCGGGLHAMIRALMIALVSVALACCATLPCAAGHDKEIALTFDDVPREPGAFMTMAERQKRLIAALKLAHVRRAAFFTNPGHLD